MNDKKICELWLEFGNIPVSEDGESIDQDFHIWSKGTDKQQIWQWFDERHSIGLYKIMEITT
jgi:hypothetical protein